MIINIREHLERNRIPVKGIIQVGCHFSQELEEFESLGASEIVLIEPVTRAYNATMAKVAGHKNISVFKVACGNEVCEKEMYVDIVNEGQSSSLLKPKKHLEQYPTITFPEKEKVFVTLLDNLPFDKAKFNILFMDCQGFELEVLKGATDTLLHISMIYTEVNREELYEGCGLVGELDQFLSRFGFTGIETNWVGESWGDKVYVKRSQAELEFDEAEYLRRNDDVADAVAKKRFKSGFEHYQKFGQYDGHIGVFFKNNILTVEETEISPLNLNKNISLKNDIFYKGIDAIYEVPSLFKPVQNIEYPEGNKVPFERYFYEYFKKEEPKTLRKYLPIFWTAYYVNNDYGHVKEAIHELQMFLNTLPTDEKYFTIVQYDDGILNDISGLDIIVYASGSNKAGYYPIPLIAQEICLELMPIDFSKKDILFSFTGANTHSIRESIVDNLAKFGNISMTDLGRSKMADQMKRSIFSLCPRGYGVTSFRISESLQFGSIPVYVSDKFIEPFNIPFNTYGIKIRENEIPLIPEILKQVNIDELRINAAYTYKNYYRYDSCSQKIIKTLQ